MMLPVALDVSGVDPTFKGHAQRGIGRYVTELKRYFDDVSSRDVQVSYFNHKELLTAGFAGTMVNALPVGRTTVRQQLLYPIRLARGRMEKASFVHFPAHMDAPAWSPKPFVLTVLDLIPLVLKDLYRSNRSGFRFHFARWLETTSIRNALALIAISECTANDIVSILDIPRDRIVVTPLGVDATFFEISRIREQKRKGDPAALQKGKEIRTALGLPNDRPLILYVGGHDERKNIRTLLAISREVLDAERAASDRVEPFLVLAGRVGSPVEAKRLRDAQVEFEMTDDSKSLGYVSDELLRELYAEASLFLFPSLYEGFGLPPLEAMAAGLPVVSSNASSLPEVLGDAGSSFDPRSLHEGAQSVLEVLRDRNLADRCVARGLERAKLFTWERTGELTLDAYRLARQLLQHPKRSTALPFNRPLTEGDEETPANKMYVGNLE